VTEEQHQGGGSNSGGRRRPRVVNLPQKREVNEGHLEQLRASGLNDETIRLADLYTESNRLAIAALIHRKRWPEFCLAALVFPFYLPGEATPYAYRVRPTKPQVRNGRPVKYDQSDQVGVLVYFTPRARAGGWYKLTDLIVYWTEGEKKALVFDQMGLCCVGLTGVWNFGDVAHRQQTNEERLHPLILEHCTVAGRHHVICFDADSRENERVMMAAARLCGVLLAAGALSVRFCAPPSAAQKGIDDFFAAWGEEGTRKLLDSATPIEPADLRNPLLRAKTIKFLHDAPVANDLRISDAYEVRKNGALWRMNAGAKHGPEPVAPSPILLQRYLNDLYTREGRVELCFHNGHDWVEQCVTRQAIHDRVTMIRELAPFGAPVTSNSAAKLVDWFEALDAVNSKVIPRVASVDRAGWHFVDGRTAFVLNEARGADEKELPIALDKRGDRRKIFEALEPRGSYDAHLAALKEAFAADPICAAVICGALAAPMLQPLGAPNFAIHLPGESSRGKTSMLKIAASVFGDPDNPHWVASWNVTPVGAEMRAVTLCDLPQCYDEVGGSDPLQTERLVYALINGAGRTRGQRDLTMRETQNWRTVVLSTGERELADESTATGAQVRVVQLPVAGFGGMKAADIDDLRRRCTRNAGHFGRAWIDSLVANTESDWAQFRTMLAEEVKRLRAMAKDPLQGRIAAYFALLLVTERTVSDLGLGSPEGQTIERVFMKVDMREAVEGIAQRARRLIEDWVLSRPDSFPVLDMGSSGEEDVPRPGKPGMTYFGFQKRDSVLIIPAEFRRFCAEHGLAPREVVREWARLEWTQLDAGRLDRSARVGGRKSHFVVLLPEPPEPDQRSS